MVATSRDPGGPPDVVFVGGGVIGLTAAWMAAQHGLQTVVVDPTPGRGASWVAAGMLAPASEAHFGEEALSALLVAGAAHWTEFAHELADASGMDVGYRRSGTIAVAVDHSDRLVVDELLAFQASIGLSATRLSASDCRRAVPALAPAISGGASFPDDHQVDNRRLVQALVAVCGAAGVHFRADRVASVIRAGRGAVTGVRLAGGDELAAGAVVLAAGSETPFIGGLPPGTIPPVRPVKGHVLRLRSHGGEPFLERTVRGLVRGRSCYLVPRADGSLVVGATVEERGFDRSVQAGAVHALLDDARRIVPGVDELELEECIAGLRPGSPDNGPFVGWTDVPRLVVATGHYRNGILLAPITGVGVAALLVGDDPPPELAAFDGRRHAPGSAASPGGAAGRG